MSAPNPDHDDDDDQHGDEGSRADHSLGQVFRNLIDNALSFSPPQGAVIFGRYLDDQVVANLAETDAPPDLPKSMKADGISEKMRRDLAELGAVRRRNGGGELVYAVDPVSQPRPLWLLSRP